MWLQNYIRAFHFQMFKEFVSYHKYDDMYAFDHFSLLNFIQNFMDIPKTILPYPGNPLI